MTTHEINQAKRALQDFADRFETVSDGKGGNYLTAHWIEGGQKLFYSLNDVANHLETSGDPAGAELLREGRFS